MIEGIFLKLRDSGVFGYLPWARSACATVVSSFEGLGTPVLPFPPRAEGRRGTSFMEGACLVGKRMLELELYRV